MECIQASTIGPFFGRCFQVIKTAVQQDGEERESCGNGEREEEEEREEEVDKEEKEGGNEEVGRRDLEAGPFQPVSLPLVLMTRG